MSFNLNLSWILIDNHECPWPKILWFTHEFKRMCRLVYQDRVVSCDAEFSACSREICEFNVLIGDQLWVLVAQFLEKNADRYYYGNCHYNSTNVFIHFWCNLPRLRKFKHWPYISYNLCNLIVYIYQFIQDHSHMLQAIS